MERAGNWMRRINHYRFGIVVLLAVLVSACYRLFSGGGGGDVAYEVSRAVVPSDVILPGGYEIQPVVTGLTFPTAITSDAHGRLYVTEAGYSYGEVITTPRLLRVESDGRLTEVARGENGPWNGVTYHDGAFYVAGGHVRGGEILKITPEGKTTVLVAGIPTSVGDHHTNGPVIGADGWVYFGQGPLTNSGVVGVDNYKFGWLTQHPKAHDIPCETITLAGRNFTTENPLTDDPTDEATTGVFVPFGTGTEAGQVIEGQVPCGGAVMRVRLDGGTPEVVAWGFRNPFGLAWGPDGALYATENQYDVRGSRPVFGASDLLWRVSPGTWYGWPDFYAGQPLTDEERFRPPGYPAPGFVLQKHPGTPPKPIAYLGVHSSSNGLDFSRHPAFGYVGEAFIAQFGDLAPSTGKVMAPVGFKVVRVNVETGVVQDFAVNRGKTNGPSSWLKSGGLERPLGLRFDPSGTSLYLVDFGVLTTVDKQMQPQPETGVLWRITKTQGGGR